MRHGDVDDALWVDDVAVSTTAHCPEWRGSQKGVPIALRRFRECGKRGPPVSLIEFDVRKDDSQDPGRRCFDRAAFDRDVVFEAAGDPHSGEILVKKNPQPISRGHVRP